VGLPIVVATLAAVLVCVLVFLSAKRGGPLPLADVVAEQVHGSRAWTFLLLGPLLVLAFVVLRIPDRGVRVVFVPVTLVFLATGAATWSGFHYRFTHSGLEIRALGFRLRSIPKEQIRHYQPSSWNWTGGYGIRGLGGDRAYVWGNSGVRIATAGGSVFLGHAEPQRLIHDLDVLTKAER
jgi:energy-coupling factor transporter transmembrane protein EcfT